MASKETVNEKSKKLLEELYNHHNNNNNHGGSKELSFNETSDLLAKFRILTREKSLDSEVLSKECIDSLVSYSANCFTEAQKCLSNLILNYAHLRDQIIEPYINCVENRFSLVLKDEYKTNDSSDGKDQLSEVLYYDLRIVFLLSALCSAARPKIRDRLVDLILNITNREAEKYSKDNHLLVVESLKTLFNLTLDKCLNISLAGDVIKKLFSVVEKEKDMTVDIKTKEVFDLTDQLLVNLIHLLTNMPKEVYSRLSNTDVDKILNHLDNQLKSYSKSSFRDTVLPVLNVCANVCKYNEEVRKKWFDEIVGSATDFEKRPEEYDTLKGRLVKLMTSVDVHIKDIAAEFMHALCGGDTEKLITYTGFGNSAAFLSSRGLLFGDRRGSNSENRSEDNTDYQELRSRLDPITGKLETPKRNPMEGMSEEEKEYHAHELADAITKLTNLGIMKPMGINQDGAISDLNPNSNTADKTEKSDD